jgi:hypothetical protein
MIRDACGAIHVKAKDRRSFFLLLRNISVRRRRADVDAEDLRCSLLDLVVVFLLQLFPVVPFVFLLPSFPFRFPFLEYVGETECLRR